MSTMTEPIESPSGTRRPSARLRFAVAFLVGLVITLGLGAGALYAYDQQYDGRILPGVQVGGVDLSGLTPGDARAKLDGAYHGLSEGRIVVAVPNGTEVITYAEIGRGLDTDALVDETLAVGRGGSVIDRAVANTRTALHGVALAPRVRFDAEKLTSRIAAIADALRVKPVEASVAADDKLAFKVLSGSSGRTVDPAEVIQTVTQAIAQLDAPAEVPATMPVAVAEPDVTTAEATDAKAAAERIVANITLVVGERRLPIDTSKMRPWVTFERTADGGYEPIIDTTKIPTLLDGLAAKIDRKPVNASFKTSGTKVTGVTASQDGYTLDVPATA